MSSDSFFEPRQPKSDEPAYTPVIPAPQAAMDLDPDVDIIREDLIALEQPRPPHPNFWMAILWSFVFLVVTQIPGAIIILIAFFILVLASGNSSALQSAPAMMESNEMRIATMFGFFCTEMLVILAGLGLIFLFVGKDWPRRIALRLPSPTHLILALLIFPAMVLLSNGAYAFIKEYVPDAFGQLGLGDMESAMKIFSNWPLPIAILIIGLGPGIGEELFCRGFLGRGLVGRYGYVAGVVMSSFFFGLIHLEPRQGMVAMLMGFVLHYTYLTTRSLFIPMLLHFMNNSFAVMASQTDLFDILDKPEGLPAAVYVGAMVLLLVVGYTLYACRARLVRPSEVDFWDPHYPGVEIPPVWSATKVTHPRPDWFQMALVALTFGGFVTQMVLTLWR